MKERLEKYKAKRDFDVTPEPPPDSRPSSKRLSFGVQKHDARRLHYDLRLEHDGVMLSWAVPKGPSLDPAEKRLAVHVEDHPLDYIHFEGMIPKGEYGAGSIIVWDIGEWEPEKDVDEMMAKGEMKFKLHGQRLHGAWTLIRLNKDDKNWLLIKERDKFAVKGDADGLVTRSTGSILKPKTGDAPLDRRSFRPMLAQVASKVPLGNKWIHEVKFDGYRITAWKESGEVLLQSRNGLDWTYRFKDIARALQAMPEGTAIDGEIVIVRDDGGTDFGALQEWLKTGKGVKPIYCVFDLLQDKGENVTRLPLLDRKALLKVALKEFAGDKHQILYSEHMVGHGSDFFKAAAQAGLEGIMSKLADSGYLQSRSSSWVKSRCIKQDEFVVGGFTEPGGTRRGIGALLVGQYDEKGKLVYAGRVGTGFDEKTLDALRKTLDNLVVQERLLVDVDPLEAKGAIWVEPKLVAQIKYTEQTKQGRLRHPVFLGLREDKEAVQVKREPIAEVKLPVKVSSPDKVLFPDTGLTKGALAEYYAIVADRMLPFVKNRPLALLRCPEGIQNDCFVQKHSTQGMPDHILAEFDSEIGLIARDVKGLVTLVQFGMIEIHPWGSHLKTIDQPDFMVFDLDPDPEVGWPRVVQAAQVVAEFLKTMDFVPFVKTSGGKGLHVVVPIKKGPTWEEFKSFSRSVAETIDKLVPGHFVTTVSKAKRKNKILIDYLRNGRGATSVGVYSVRAREGAPVSVPVTWEQLPKLSSPAQFTVDNVRDWLPSEADDPWAGLEKSARSITEKAWKTVGGR